MGNRNKVNQKQTVEKRRDERGGWIASVQWATTPLLKSPSHSQCDTVSLNHAHTHFFILCTHLCYTPGEPASYFGALSCLSEL